MLPRSPIGIVLIAASLTGCGSLPAASGGAAGGPPGAGGSNVVVLEDEELSASRGNLLNTLTSRISQLRVTADGNCPRLELRGRSSMYGSSDPSVYLDGARAVNTCVLEQIPTSDVRRVEVYPMGVTSRPGYRSNAGGLILVFSRDAEP